MKHSVRIESLNTNWDLLFVEGVYYLRDNKSWLSAAALDGDWTAVTDLPAAITALPEDGNWQDARAAIPATGYEGAVPEVYYADGPAELIHLEGEAEFADVPGGDLEWVSNTEADLFRLKSSGEWF